MAFMYRYVSVAVLFACTVTVVAAQNGPKNAVVLIIRHAEDAETGHGLSSRGEQRAERYKDYFLRFSIDSKQLEPQAIFAAKDSKKSHRPSLTVEPFAKAAKLQIDTRFGNSQSAELAAELRATQQGKIVLVCWRHGEIPDLLRTLGASPENLLPHGKWPNSVYDWVIILSYDQDGRLVSMSPKRINEHLLPGDSP
jgi:hypothetical protein